MAIKFKDANPSNRVAVGMMGIGPFTKNLARLYDAERELTIKEIMGIASALCQSILGMATPWSFLGKNDDASMIRANDMWN